MAPKQDNAKAPQSRQRKMILAAILVVGLSLVGGGAYAISTGKLDWQNFFESADAENAEADAQMAPSSPSSRAAKPLFKNLDKIVVSLLQDRQVRYMMLELSLVGTDPRMPEQVDRMNMVIRNSLLHYFSGKGYQQVREELLDLAKLQSTLREQLIRAAANYGETLAVEEVLLTNVVVQ